MASILYKGRTEYIYSIGGAPPANIWSPASLSPVIWLDALITSSITLSSGAVLQWYDISGNSNHANQANGGNRPTYVSKSYVSFNGSSSFLATTASTAGEITVMFVARQNRNPIATNSIDNVFSYNPFPASPNNKGIALNTSNYFGSSTQRQIYLEDTASGTVDARKNGQVSPLTLNYQEWFIGGYIGSGITGQSGRALELGRININNGTFFYGANDISELFVVNSALGTSDRQKAEGYLAHKWGLASQLDSGHPYKSAPP